MGFKIWNLLKFLNYFQEGDRRLIDMCAQLVCAEEGNHTNSYDLGLSKS